MNPDERLEFATRAMTLDFGAANCAVRCIGLPLFMVLAMTPPRGLAGVGVELDFGAATFVVGIGLLACIGVRDAGFAIFIWILLYHTTNAFQQW
jgi:hypothetical protein